MPAFTGIDKIVQNRNSEKYHSYTLNSFRPGARANRHNPAQPDPVITPTTRLRPTTANAVPSTALHLLTSTRPPEPQANR